MILAIKFKLPAYAALLAGLLLTGYNAAAAQSADVQQLCRAAAQGDIGVIRRLLSQDPQIVNRTGPDGVTALHAAAHNGHRTALLLLTANGADINARDQQTGASPLMMAVLGDQPTVMEALVRQSADINQAANQGTTPLHMAAYLGRKHLVEFLIEKGADVTITNNNGLTALQWALNNNQRETAAVLAEAAANLPPEPEPPEPPEPPTSTTPTQPDVPTPATQPPVAEPAPAPEPAPAAPVITDHERRITGTAVANLQAEIEEAAQWIGELQVKLARAREEHSATRQQLAKEITLRNESTRNLEKHLQSAMSDAELYRQRFESAVLEKVEIVQSLRARIAQLQQEKTNAVERLSMRLEQSDKRIKKQSEKIRQLEETLQQERMEQTRDQATRQQPLMKIRQATARAEQLNMELNTRLAAQGARLQQLEHSLADSRKLLSKSRSQAEQEITQLQTQIQALTEELETKNNHQAEDAAIKLRLQQDLDERNRRLETVKQQAEHLTDDLRQQLNNIKIQLEEERQSRAADTDTLQQLAEMHTARMRAEQANQDLQGLLEAQDARQLQLEKTLTENRQLYDEMRQQCMQEKELLKDRILRMGQNLREMSQRLQQREAQLIELRRHSGAAQLPPDHD